MAESLPSTIFPETLRSLLEWRLVRTKRRRRRSYPASFVYSDHRHRHGDGIMPPNMYLFGGVCHVVVTSASASIFDRHHDIINSAGCPNKWPALQSLGFQWEVEEYETLLLPPGLRGTQWVYHCNYADRHRVCNSPFWACLGPAAPQRLPIRHLAAAPPATARAAAAPDQDNNGKIFAQICHACAMAAVWSPI